MLLTKKRLFSLVCSLSVCLLLTQTVLAKRIVVDEGQAKLMQDINAGQKSKQLTAKEANGLRKDLARVARKKTKMLGKGNGKLNNEDMVEIKSNLIDIRTNMQKLELAKSVNK